jgi:hypothetical protein
VKLTPPCSTELNNGGAIPLPHTSSWRVAKLIQHRATLTFLLFMDQIDVACSMHEYGIVVGT